MIGNTGGAGIVHKGLNKKAGGGDFPALVRSVIGRIYTMMMMLLKGVLTGATAAGMMLAISAFAPAQTRQPGSVNSGYAPVNGLKLYYEIHGTGEPLILLHGGLGSTEMFADIMPVLSQGHRAIAVDLQAHGRTGDIDRPMSFDAMADDIAALMKYLGVERADLMGYSIGGAVALRTAVRHPEVVRKLVLVSTPFKHDGWYPEVSAAMAQMGAGAAEVMKQTPIYQVYSRVAPKPADFPVLLNKVGDLIRQDYDWSKDVAGIKSPTLLVFGDADAVRPEHMVRFFELLGGGKKDAGWDGSGMSNARLAILPGLTHYNIISSATLASTVAPFLEGPMAVHK